MGTVEEALASLAVFAVVIENDRVVEVRQTSLEELAAWSDQAVGREEPSKERKGGERKRGKS